MIVRDGFHFFVWKDPAKLAAPCLWKTRISAATRAKEESAMTEVFAEIGYFSFLKNEFVVAVHEDERRFEEVRVGQLHFPLFLDFQGGCARHKFHEVLADADRKSTRLNSS